MERETGIEPAPSAWKAEVLPLNYSRDSGVLWRSHRSVALRPGGGRWIRTTEGVSQQIYSLPPLAAWVSLRYLFNCDQPRQMDCWSRPWESPFAVLEARLQSRFVPGFVEAPKARAGK